ncbi:substrate-binding periplasmic protein [Duganella violaceipulchra]|uniref:Polar amino acid transport system substrate-binding protein n=1 Tax=Duganella violaceipulchra TaxID=2849652 RepID=A0AA41H503_9BURK|nr:transporter substrate-binding domain-containing protein [Duganella violaceicalia]MBV6320069.1 transporter substrate-binding domain-containing protein [Duganella violaceicalia]MCP2010435.1 polar amino acid transport system substrate-binding protein [Duganella violaceicalia]
MFMRMLACGLLLCLGGAALADPGACRDINVAFHQVGALYYRAPDGGWTGIDKDVVDELGKRTGCRFLPSLESRVRIWTMLAGGKLDMSMSGIATPAREKFARFIPYFATRNYALLDQSVPASASTAEGFLAAREYKVAVVKSYKHGAAYDLWLDKLRAQGRVYEAADFPAVVRLLKIGRVHAILALPVSWVPILKREGLSESVRVLDWAPREHLVHGLIVSRERIPVATAERMAKAIESMRNDGTLLTIFKRHIGDELASGLLNY